MNDSDMIKDLPDGSEFLDGRVLDRLEPMVGQECLHILGMKVSSSNAVYIIDSETDKSHIDHLKKPTRFGSTVYELEWFEFCPRCGKKLG